MKDKIIIQTQLTKITLTKAVKEILSSNSVVKYTWIIGVLMIILAALLFIYVFKVQSYAPMLGVFCGTFLLFFKNIMTFFSVQKLGPQDIAYEALTYKFDASEIDIKGETFTVKLYWENIKKVKETADFFLIFQKTLAANIVDKNDFTQKQLFDFRALLQTIEHIEKDIKNND